MVSNSWEVGPHSHGLVVSQDRRSVLKPLNAACFTMHSRCTLIGTHAFSAQLQPRGVLPETQQQGRHLEIMLRASSCGGSDPSVLVGVAAESPLPEEDVLRYKQRILQTPMLWDEPHAYFVECRKSGGYLWSAQGGHSGLKISDECLIPTKATSFEQNVLHAVVRFSWTHEGFSVRFNDSVDPIGCSFAAESEKLEMSPFVTLMQPGDSAILP